VIPYVSRLDLYSYLLSRQTACTLTFAIYLLSQHPKILAKLRTEILNRVGQDKRPDYDDVKDLKYLRAVINETLRLYPPVPFDIRASTKATLWPSTVPGGKPIYVPANTIIVYSVWAMHRRKDLWGPDADNFDPDRFIDERLGKYLTPNPFIFTPFNAGPRICLGQQFAYNEVSFFLIRLLQNFSAIFLAEDAQTPPPASWKSMEEPRRSEKVWPKSHLTLYSHEGMWVRMQEVHDN